MRYFVIVLGAVLLASCSPKGTPIPPDPAHWDQLSDKAKHLSDDDRRLFTAYLARAALTGAFNGGKPIIPPGTTIGQAIDAQKKFEADAAKSQADQEILKAKAAAERASAESALNNAAIVTLVAKTYIPKNYQAERFSDSVGFIIAVHNKTAKDISGIKGTLEFDDMFGALIKSINISMDKDVKAGQIFTTSDYSIELNQFDNGDSKIAQTDLNKMKVTFHPEMIVFSDGSKMTTPTDTEGPP